MFMMPFWGTYFHLAAWLFMWFCMYSDLGDTQKSSPATLELRNLEFGDPGDPTNRVLLPWRPQQSSPATLETSKIESGNRQRCCLSLSLRQQRCCLRGCDPGSTPGSVDSALTPCRPGVDPGVYPFRFGSEGSGSTGSFRIQVQPVRLRSVPFKASAGRSPELIGGRPRVND